MCLAATACQPPEREIVRLTDLRVAAEGVAEPESVASGITVAREPYHVPVELSGARVGRLTLVARGDAPSVDLTWKLASEKRFTRFRKLTVPLVADGEEHRYEVDLTQEPYWVGDVDRLQLTVDEGSLEVIELVARPEGAARTAALTGLTLPSLPGLRRLELELPMDAPREAEFEVHLGLAPQFDRPGASAHFRVRVGEGDAPDENAGEVWLDETVEGGRERRWHRVSTTVRVPRGDRLVLEVEATRHGEPLPEGAAMWGAPVLARPDPPAAPHLVILLVDTLRADALGAYGSTDGLTPHLDRLAEESVRFANLQAPSPWTLPTTASLLTGLQPQSHDTGRTLQKKDFVPTGLVPGAPTLAGVLAAEGFFTVGVYNNIFLGPSFGVSRGFDLYHWIEKEDDVLVDRALELFHRYHDQRRLFVLLHLFGPHNPYAPPGDACDVARRLEPGYEGSIDCEADRRPGLPVPPQEDRPWMEALYRAEAAYTDRQIGRFLDALEELGVMDRTVLVMVSDHGEDFWGRLDSYGVFGGYHDADHGHSQYQELLWVPGIVRAPGIEPGVLEEPVEIVDLFPTVLSLLGVEPKALGVDEGAGDERGEPTPLRDLLQGEDLAPVLYGEGEPSPRRTRIADFLLYGTPRTAVRKGPWKLIFPGDGAAEHGHPSLEPELYHLEADPGERNNLHAERPEIAASLRRLAEEEMARREELRRRLQGGPDALNAAHLQWNHITRLRALGYLK